MKKIEKGSNNNMLDFENINFDKEQFFSELREEVRKEKKFNVVDK